MMLKGVLKRIESGWCLNSHITTVKVLALVWIVAAAGIVPFASRQSNQVKNPF